MELDLLTQYTSDRTPEERFEILKNLLAKMGEGFVLADHTGKFILWSKKATAILGKGPFETDPSKWTDYYGCYYEDMVTPIPPEDLPLAKAISGVAVDDMVMYINNDKKKAWVVASSCPVQLMDKTGGMVFFRDITAVKEAENRATHIIKSLRQINEQQLEILRTT